jgi:predicted nucleic acid-binding protein
LVVVVDASALVMAVLGRSASARDLRERLAAEVCHAPHLIDAEVGNALRRQVLRGELLPLDGQILLTAAPALIDYRHEMTGVLARAAWLLRDNLSFYDALYAALAQALTCPLLTADKRLTQASALPCAVELVPAS